MSRQNRSHREAEERRQSSKIQSMRLRKKRQRKMLSRGSMIAVIIIFCCCIGVVGQRIFISNLDQQVQTLEENVETLRSENDARQGQLTESQNDTEIKATARSYGMTEATASQKIIETITKQEIDDTTVEKDQWYHNLFE